MAGNSSNSHSSNSSSSPFNVRFPSKPAAKKSLFERQRAEAEAKRQREAAETAAVYEDFVKSFDDGAGSSSSSNSRTLATTGASIHPPPAHLKSGVTVGATGGRRHFSMPSAGPGGHRNSGPGSLGPVNHYGSRPVRDGRPSRPSGIGSRLGFGSDDDDDDNNYSNNNNNNDDNNDNNDEINRNNGRNGNGRDTESRKRKANDSEEEGQIVEKGGSDAPDHFLSRAEEKAISKPTIRMANLRPGTSPAAIKALLASSSSLVVDAVRILPTTTASSATATDRKSVTAIVTLSAETAASDIDAAVSAMQNRYLGFGYYLNLHRHLSSAIATLTTGPGGVAGVGNNNISSNSGSIGGASAQPFGARPVPPAPKSGPGAQKYSSDRFAPPPMFQQVGRHGRGIPPPASFTSPAANANMPNRDSLLYVPVRPPRDIKKLRMIHKVVEQVLNLGPEFEALLMSRPAVQLDEKWAWLWDARSEAGVWYRYRLWETVTGLRTQKSIGSEKAVKGRYVPLFQGSHAWKTPDQFLPYEFDTSLAELASDSDCNSSDDSDADAAAGDGGNDDDVESFFLNPLEKARLTHLLARLPTTLSKLRKGDVARVTAFALTHASRGANEIVDMIVANVERPLAYTAANPGHHHQRAPQAQGPTDEAAIAAAADIDTSGAQLIAVYVVSDILSASATSGIRHAWRFRQLFDTALRHHNVFATLGRLSDKLHWGRLRADKWKRSIGLVLDQWEGWSVFPAETQAFLVSSFENPPSIKGNKGRMVEEKDAAAAAAAASSTSAGMDNETTMAVSSKKSRWRTVDTTAAPAQGSFAGAGAGAATAAIAASGFRLVDMAARDADDKMQVDSEVVEERDSSGDNNNDDAGNDADDEWAYRSDYTDDEALDLACMSDEDIDGEPLELPKIVDRSRSSDGRRGNERRRRRRRRHRYDGIPLTADEISALVGDVAELSEEGEIATDDDDDVDGDGDGIGDGNSKYDDDEAYNLSGLSSLSDDSSSSSSSTSSSSSRESGSDEEGHKGGNENNSGTRDVAMSDAPLTTTTTEQPEADMNSATLMPGTPSSASVPAVRAQLSSEQASSMDTRTKPATTTLLAPLKISAPLQPRKRMRAADMFADSDEDGGNAT
ncbi:MAG: hypothetical protein STHCBS139747_002054 [Sporothrix thermara]